MAPVSRAHVGVRLRSNGADYYALDWAEGTGGGRTLATSACPSRSDALTPFRVLRLVRRIAGVTTVLKQLPIGCASTVLPRPFTYLIAVSPFLVMQMILPVCTTCL